jgi:hypothetical protein
MSLRRWLYQVNNWRAHYRGLRRGTKRQSADGLTSFAGELDGTIIRPSGSALLIATPSIMEMWRHWCDERGADAAFAESPDHARGILCGLGLLPTERYALGTLSRRVVTDAGVAFLADDFFDASKDITTFDYHDSGTGVVAENVADTTLGTQAGPATRATGTASNPTAPVYRSVGTISYTGTLAIAEHGLFDQAAQGGTLWDRSTHATINVVNLDSIQYTYSLTSVSGG